MSMATIVNNDYTKNVSKPIESRMHDEKDYKLQSNCTGIQPMIRKPNSCVLKFEDGDEFWGISFGAETHSVSGECVFQTGMVGYVETLTDASYSGQILVFTNPLFGNYGYPAHVEDPMLEGIPAYFESYKIHVSAVVVGTYSEDYSHYLAKGPVSEWLKQNDIPAIHGVDTRALVKKIRSTGVLKAKLLLPKALLRSKVKEVPDEELNFGTGSLYQNVEWRFIENENLVDLVSVKEERVYVYKNNKVRRLKGNKEMLRILAVDFGMKYSQIRCMAKCGVEVKVVNWDYDFYSDTNYDGLFLSNGPGDPKQLGGVINRLREQMKNKNHQVPIFGICLGHQLLALAAGAETEKMLYGNRGFNIPAINTTTKKCIITSQNHGYAVRADTLPEDWSVWFYNANDNSNEGIKHKKLPFFSVQFHPESSPGPNDASYLFDYFVGIVEKCNNQRKLIDIEPEIPFAYVAPKIPRKILVIGSGALSIGQAGEFDYSGSQAIKAFREEGIYTVLINPNIATIQTSRGLADKIIFLPITPESVLKVINYESPDAISCSFGGQIALNVILALKSEIEERGIRILGTSLEKINASEDRELFLKEMKQVGETCAKSETASDVDSALQIAEKIGYPVIVRSAYTLGGFGSGFAENRQELERICVNIFSNTSQILIECSMKGWKEVEYEVLRDEMDNVVIVCNMENFDPLGIHTGDSIVVAPSQTLNNSDYMLLRDASLRIARGLKIIGECNIQFALNPDSQQYCVIEVNARLSRSSALASKATGYPIAFVAAKLSLGFLLPDIINNITKQTVACFEPSLDYCVVKMPRWDLKKFLRVDTKISSCMKSVGEAMAIGRTFEEAIQTAIREVDYIFDGFTSMPDMVDLDEELKNPSYLRIFAIARALNKGYSVDRIFDLTKIDKWFLNRLKKIACMEDTLRMYNLQNIEIGTLLEAKQLGFSDKQISKCLKTTELAIRKIRIENCVVPYVKQVDTVAGEFPAKTNYLYLTYNAQEHDVEFNSRAVVVLGSGVYRIGSSVEFDWCAVGCITTLRSMGLETILINYNPETVSTDYDTTDRLYLEDLSLERIMDIYELEMPMGIIISMGGQAPNNLAMALSRQNIKILGTAAEMIDAAENRYKFSRMLDSLAVDQPRWKELSSLDHAVSFCEEVGYPVLVRPSYVLSGAAMNVVYTKSDLDSYLKLAVKVSPEYPVVISKFIEGAKEIEIDAVSSGGKIVISVISEHIENAGVHSGDATLVFPPQDLDPETVSKIYKATSKIGKALNVTGPFNIQFIAKNNEIKVIECNLRASRSFPFISKALGIDLVNISTNVIMDKPVNPMEPRMRKNIVAVKVPQFSFSRLVGADPILGVEMSSTGEVACFGEDKYQAYLKALLSTGFKIPKSNILISIGSYKEKIEFLPSVMKLHKMGYNLFATSGTADFMQEHNIPIKYLEMIETNDKIGQKKEYSLIDHLRDGLIDLYINLPSSNRFRRPMSYMTKGYLSRRMAVDNAIPLITNIKCAKYFVEALSRHNEFEISTCDYQTSHATIHMPNQVLILSPEASGVKSRSEFLDLQRLIISEGFTTICNVPMSLAKKDEEKQDSESYDICDYSLSICIEEFFNIAPNVHYKSLTICKDFDAMHDVDSLNKCLKKLPCDKVIVIDSTHKDLYLIMHIVNMYGRRLHVSNVTHDTINQIKISKSLGMKVTCDMNICNLLNEYYDENLQKECKLSQQRTQNFMDTLSKHLRHIDCFSVSYNTLKLAKQSGATKVFPVLLSFVEKRLISIDEIKDMSFLKPKKIFGLPYYKGTKVEVAVGYNGMTTMPCEEDHRKVVSSRVFIHRITIRGNLVYLDGKYINICEGKTLISDNSIETDESADEDTSLDKSTSYQRGTMCYIPSNLMHQNFSTGNIQQEPKTFMNQTVHQKKISVPKSNFSQPEYQSLSEIPATINSDPRFDIEDNANLVSTDKQTEIELLGNLEDYDYPKALKKPLETERKNSSFHHTHVLMASQFSRSDMHELFAVAQHMKIFQDRYLKMKPFQGKIACLAFFEPSTRTECSFESAFKRLGGSVIKVNAITSSLAKGEDLSDTVRTLQQYSDIIVLRHPERGSSISASKYSNVPIINAGDGSGEHPTQALTDAFTIREECGKINGLTILLVGDLRYGRTVHSLVRILCNYSANIIYSPIEGLEIPEDVKTYAQKAGISQVEMKNLEEAIPFADVIYMTRVQKERFSSEEEYGRCTRSYALTSLLLQKAKKKAVILHPFPRINEIDREVDYDERAVYFRQMKHGLYLRMALLLLLCGEGAKSSK